jgi:hypothetical protein
LALHTTPPTALQLPSNLVDCVGNVMAHAQKPDFVFRRNRRVHLNRRGASVQSTTGSRGVCISLQGLCCSYKPVFCIHVTVTGYPLHSLVSPSLLLPCVTECHHISTGLYCYTCTGRLNNSNVCTCINLSGMKCTDFPLRGNGGLRCHHVCVSLSCF